MPISVFCDRDGFVIARRYGGGWWQGPDPSWSVARRAAYTALANARLRAARRFVFSTYRVPKPLAIIPMAEVRPEVFFSRIIELVSRCPMTGIGKLTKILRAEPRTSFAS